MEEKKNSAVNVEDVESDAMESMLQFIYTGERSLRCSGHDRFMFTAKLDFLESASMELASRLLAAADKYSLPRLKVCLKRYQISALSMLRTDLRCVFTSALLTHQYILHQVACEECLSTRLTVENACEVQLKVFLQMIL